MQLCSLADVDGEASAGYLHAEVEVDEVVFLGQFPMGHLGLVVHGVGSPVAYGVFRRTLLEVAFHYAVVFGSNSFGYFVVRDVGNGAEQFREVLLSLVHLLFESFVHLFE